MAKNAVFPSFPAILKLTNHLSVKPSIQINYNKENKIIALTEQQKGKWVNRRGEGLVLQPEYEKSNSSY